MDTTEKASRSRFGFLAVLLALSGSLGCGGDDPNVVTQHNNNLRTGAYLAETTLTPDSVRAHGMHVKYWLAPTNSIVLVDPPERPAGFVDGSIVTQMLYMRNVLNERTANGLFVATTSNKVYGFDADTGSQRWMRDLMENGPGKCDVPKGVNSTPVIDPFKKRMYVLFRSEYPGGHNVDCPQVLLPGPSTYYLAVLDITTGNYAPGFGTPVVEVKTSVRRADGSTLNFNPTNQMDRAGLLLENGSVYVAFGADGYFEGLESNQYHGWVMRFNAADLTLQSTFCTSPNATPEDKKFGNSGIWQGGGGLAADPYDTQSNVFFLTGNGPSDFPSNSHARPFGHSPSPPNSWGDSIVKIKPSGGLFTPRAFVPDDADLLDLTDADLGSGGAMLIPDSNLVIGGGKTGIMYVLDRSSMRYQGEFEASTNQYHPWWRGQTWDGGPHLHGSPTYWNSTYGYLYVWGEKDFLRSYRFDRNTKKFEQDSGNPSAIKLYKQGPIMALHDTMPGGMLSVSANGSKEHTGIVWATLPIARCPWGSHCPDPRSPPKPPFSAAVYAFDAEDLTLLWNASIGDLAHWVPPTIADGKVFVATNSGGIAVYDLCLQGMQCVGSSTPILPPTNKCVDCHNFLSHIEAQATTAKPLRNLFPNEARVWGSMSIALKALAPPRGHSKNLILEGNGVQTYEAKEDPTARNKLVWQLRGSTADLLEVTSPVSVKEMPPPIRVRLSEGFEWSASDGSTLHAEVQTTTPAPVGTDADWILFKVTKSSGQGILNKQSFLQCVYTDGGHAPAGLPRRRGEVTRVPYSAQYWLYQ